MIIAKLDPQFQPMVNVINEFNASSKSRWCSVGNRC